MKTVLLAFLQALCYRSSSVELFESTLESFDQKGFIFEITTCNKILFLVNKYLKEDGFLEIALQFIERKKVELDIASYNILIDYYSQMGNFEKAQAIFKSLPDKGLDPDCKSFNNIIKGIKFQKNLDQKLVLDLFEIYCEKFEKQNHDLRTYNIILDILISAKNMEKVDEVFHQLTLNEHLVPDPTTFNTIIKGFCK